MPLYRSRLNLMWAFDQNLQLCNTCAAEVLAGFDERLGAGASDARGKSAGECFPECVATISRLTLRVWQ